MLTRIKQLAAGHNLAVMGGFNTDGDEGLPQGTRCLLLLGPAEPGFWPHLTLQPEWLDGKEDPVDRWSRRAIGGIACAIGAKALFPFGGPPWHPFYQWALRSGRTWDSPVRLLVNDTAGLFVSFRGALALKDSLDLPPPPSRPCDLCADKPCQTACPVNALTADGYDLKSCHSHLDTPQGQGACMTLGCAARRACPLSQGYARMAEQSAYHMGQFHK